MSALTPLAARQLTDRIRYVVEQCWDLVIQAYESRAWQALGYESWDAYCAAEFGASRLRLPREERREVVQSLRDSGLTIRAIEAATGASRKTVLKDLHPVVEIPPSQCEEPAAAFGNYPPEPVDYSYRFAIHWALNHIPEFTGSGFDWLVSSIERRGLILPITLTADGATLVDGRARLRACDRARVDPHFKRLPEAFTDEHIVAYICSANLVRTHLTADQRAAYVVATEASRSAS